MLPSLFGRQAIIAVASWVEGLSDRMASKDKGSAARLRREAAKARLLAHNADAPPEANRLLDMAAMLEREAVAIDEALQERG